MASPASSHLRLAHPPHAVPAPRMPAIGEQPLLGIPLALTDYEETLDWIDACVAHRRRSYICVATVYSLMLTHEDPELRDAMHGADFTVPDGQPLVWAMNALGHEESTRVYGPDLMEKACERAKESGARMYLYGGRNQGALVQLALNLRRRFPGLQIVGGYSPPYRELTGEEADAIAGEINRSRADIVWVGIGAPKQEKWIAKMRDRIEAPMMIGVGAAFDFHAGLVAQAPKWIQKLGLEWAFRLATEPRRLWRRYARYNPLFVRAFAWQYVKHRLRPRRA